MDSNLEPSIHGNVCSLFNTFEWVGMTGHYGDGFVSEFIQLWDGNNSHSIGESCTRSPSCHHNHIVSYKYRNILLVIARNSTPILRKDNSLEFRIRQQNSISNNMYSS